MLRYFGYSIIVTLLSLIFVFFHGYEKGGLSIAFYNAMANSDFNCYGNLLSFDNAI